MYCSVLEKVGFFYNADVLWLAYKSFLDKYPKLEQENLSHYKREKEDTGLLVSAD